MKKLATILSIVAALVSDSILVLFAFEFIRNGGNEASFVAMIIVLLTIPPSLVFTFSAIRLLKLKQILSPRLNAHERKARIILSIFATLYLLFVGNVVLKPFIAERQMKNDPNYSCIEKQSGLSCTRIKYDKPVCLGGDARNCTMVGPNDE